MISAEAIPAELASLIDLDPVRAAESEIAEAQRRHQAARDAARAAARDLQEAQQVPARLLEASLSGTAVSAATLARAYRRIEDTTRYVDFTRELERRLQPDPREGEQRLARARAQAYDALLQGGIDAQIRAAERGDRAAGAVDRNPDLAERAAAKAEFEAASRIVLCAIQQGARPVHQPTWPVTAHQLCRIWGRAEAAEEIAA